MVNGGAEVGGTGAAECGNVQIAHLHRQPQNAPANARARAVEPVPEDPVWRLEPHVCRVCFSRLVSASLVGRKDWRRYHCPNCGATADGTTPAVVCGCGVRVPKRDGSAGSTPKAGLHCVKNSAPTPEFPSLYVLAERES